MAFTMIYGRDCVKKAVDIIVESLNDEHYENEGR